MPRYFLELSYRGTRYQGFQVQDTGATIQSEVERALQTRFRQPFSLTGSSRTDSGVHAVQNFFHFDTDLGIDQQSVYNLNALLPQDIAVRGIYTVPDTAHSRFDAVSREYRYYIYTHKNPFLQDRGWLYPYPFDQGLLAESARILLEYNDFTSFSKRNTQVKTFLCTLELSEWTETETGWMYRVRANRFLRGMVRGLVGTMLKTARGQLSLDGFRAVIAARDCSKADFSTPPQGLFLHKVNYPAALADLLQ
jgi:tRNA pseudouridine38-40 synthase